ncbi:hypothetical protein ARMGADRAFT_946869 [Armillaria gallica]|uniref:Uncharacterized protein n=1 Tax=Armillaria gallica TaxID=47427 RepID=A0A2H3CGS8_ARMGA|nr:hypothetical protein ARMGADRAFT_946869 [Armillaria gallica]
MVDDGRPDMALEIEDQFVVNGMKLATMTQAIAYHGIKEQHGKCQRKATDYGIDRIRASIADVNGIAPSDAMIWRAMRNNNISRNVRGFLWKVTHKAYRLGNAWTDLGPEYASQALCLGCGAEETMEHILLDCSIPGQEQVWSLTQGLWEKKGHMWPCLLLGLILGCMLYEPKSNVGKTLTGAARLFRIMISESAHLIWKLQCERRIVNSDDPEKWPTDNEITGHWVHMIKQRLTLDRLANNPRKYGKRAIKKETVL